MGGAEQGRTVSELHSSPNWLLHLSTAILTAHTPRQTWKLQKKWAKKWSWKWGWGRMIDTLSQCRYELTKANRGCQALLARKLQYSNSPTLSDSLILSNKSMKLCFSVTSPETMWIWIKTSLNNRCAFKIMLLNMFKMIKFLLYTTEI